MYCFENDLRIYSSTRPRMSTIRAIMMTSRKAISLVELLVVLAILALLLGLSIPSIQKGRESANKIKSKNNIKQLILGYHTYNSTVKNTLLDSDKHLVHLTILMHMDGGNNYLNSFKEASSSGSPMTLSVPFFLSPSDPSFGKSPIVNNGITTNYDPGPIKAVTSYPYNAQIFGKKGSFPESILDGTSNSIAFAEHYSVCNESVYSLFSAMQMPFQVIPNIRRASFADTGTQHIDVHPITINNQSSMPSVPGKTFQVKPKLDECDSSLPQTPHASGMIIAMFDGSVRTVSPRVEPSVFWSAVTPSGGEVGNVE
jgi:prepilin-type processing-associated H-X9-DG protein